MTMSMFRRCAVSFFAVSLLVLAGCASSPKTASTGQMIDDTVITTKVKTAIFEDPALKSMEISVETYKGIVQLSGFASSSTAVLKAAEAARKVEGVQGVKNSLIVK